MIDTLKYGEATEIRDSVTCLVLLQKGISLDGAEDLRHLGANNKPSLALLPIPCIERY